DILTPTQHILHFKKEKRRGKVVTLVGRFSLHVDDVKKLLKELKQSLGCGGSYKEPYMEFQGELQEKLKEALKKKDFRFKQ
ncbi:MAG: translation initiation factor, partial [Campylobacterota bacterium]|nr:translation initiation factor [Campylobacterota bacterium]